MPGGRRGAGGSFESAVGCSMGDSGSKVGGGGVTARAGACLYCALKEEMRLVMAEGEGAAAEVPRQLGVWSRSYGAAALCEYAEVADAGMSCSVAAEAQRRRERARGRRGQRTWWRTRRRKGGGGGGGGGGGPQACRGECGVGIRAPGMSRANAVGAMAVARAGESRRRASSTPAAPGVFAMDSSGGGRGAVVGSWASRVAPVMRER